MTDKQDKKECAELMAKVIAQKKARADFRDFLRLSPGRIYGLELNLEKIYI